jgi:ubiquinone/menaquinone biosynthesis C-methylase UbiE
MIAQRQRFSAAPVWFDRVGHRYDDAMRIRSISAEVGSSAPSVLEVGCGDGSALEVIGFGDGDRLCVGIDLHLAALQSARDSLAPAVHLSVADATALPFASRSFSTVVCAEVLEHLPTEARKRALAELSRVARERVVISVPNRERLQRRHITCPACASTFHLFGHAARFTVEALRNLVPGFRCRSIRALGPRRNEWLPLLDGPWRLSRLENEFILCPECGWRGSGLDLGGRSAPAMKLLSRILVAVFGRFGSRRWLLGVYERENGDQGTAGP